MEASFLQDGIQHMSVNHLRSLESQNDFVLVNITKLDVDTKDILAEAKFLG